LIDLLTAFASDVDDLLPIVLKEFVDIIGLLSPSMITSGRDPSIIA
jgi:hypothetical protein